MKKILLTLISCCLLSAAPRSRLALIDISVAGPQELQRLKNADGVHWWVEIGGALLADIDINKIGDINATESISGSRRPAIKILPDRFTAESLRVLVAGHESFQLPAGVEIIAESGRLAVIHGTADDLQSLVEVPAVKIDPVKPFDVLSRIARNDASVSRFFSEAGTREAKGNPLAGVADEISLERWRQDVNQLAGWNRHISADGNVEARDFIRSQLEAIAGMQVSLQEFRVSGRVAWNVVGFLPATVASGVKVDRESGQNRTMIIGGHYDSISERVAVSAPGAEDNASGAAGVIELARIMGNQSRRHDLYFIAFSGEEQGLHGSAAFVRQMTSAEREKIASVLTMDMIAYSEAGTGGRPGVIVETYRKYESLARVFAEAAASSTKLDVTLSYNPFGSDHMSFLDKGIPAILAIDSDWNKYDHYHRTSDTPDRLVPEVAFEILKMNAAALVMLDRR